jgi:transposase-like protein
MDEMEIDSSMKKIKKLVTQDALKKWEMAHEKWRKGIFT